MAITHIKVPALPESIADATIAAWHKKPGDFVKRDENIVDLETDKVVLEVPALEDGILQEIVKPVGTTVLAGEILALFAAGAAAAEPMVKSAVTSQDPKTEAHLSPAVKRAVQEHAVDSAAITGSGKEGRILKEDVTEFMRKDRRVETRVAMTRLRQRIAQRLLEVKNTTAMLTTFNEVNLQAVIELRQKYKDIFEKKYGARLGFMSFFTIACIQALKSFPTINASIDGTDVVYHGYFDIGMAISTDRGLVVPILRNADQLSMAEIELSIVDFAKRARDGKLTLEELTGGTFSITNGGVFGSMLSTPIINPPQSAILGMHTIQQRPIAENGQVVIRPMMYLALSYDHRIVDGKEAISFLVAIKEQLEDPSRLLLSV